MPETSPSPEQESQKFSPTNFNQLELAIEDLDSKPSAPSVPTFTIDAAGNVLACDEAAKGLLFSSSQSVARNIVDCRRLSSRARGEILDSARELLEQAVRGAKRLLSLDLDQPQPTQPNRMELLIEQDRADPGRACRCYLVRYVEPLFPDSARPQGHSAIDGSGLVFWSYDAAHEIFDLAHPLDSLLQRPVDWRSCSLSQWQGYVAPQDRALVASQFHRFGSLKHGFLRLRYRLVTKGGTPQWITSYLWRELSGSADASRPQIRGLHRPERPLANEKGDIRLLSYIAKHVAVPTVIADADGKISWVNSAFERLTGYAFHEVAGHFSGEMLQGPLSESAASRKVEQLLAQGQAACCETIHYTKAGSPYSACIDASPLLDRGGSITHRIEFHSVADSLSPATVTNAPHDAAYHSVFANSLDAMLIVSKSSGAVFEANASAEAFFASRELTQRTAAQLLRSPSAPSLHDLRQAALSRSLLYFDLENAVGRRLPVELSASDIPLGTDSVLLITLRDLTEKRQLEEQLRHAQRMEAVGKLSGSIAHDFNNLLAGIRGFSELLDDPSLPDQHRNYVTELLKTVERGSQLTSRLLSFSRKQASALKPACLSRIAGDIVPMLTRILTEGVQFTTDIAKGPLPCRIDVGQIEQVIMNLIVNAQEATSEPDRRISLATGQAVLAGNELFITGKAKSGPYATLSIADNGHGIPKDLLKKVFEPFFTTKSGAGTGLGLSIVYGIVDSCHGHLEVESEVGKGTRFTLFLPTIDQAELQGGSDGGSAPAAPHSGSASCTVLVAEDQEQVRDILQISLEQQGYKLLMAEDGRHAMDLASEHPGRIDILVTDAIMPRMHGARLAEMIRQVHPDIKVILMSGLPQEEAMQETDCRQPIDAYVDKPFSMRHLIATIASLMAKQD